MIRSLVEGRERHATLRHRNYRKDGSVIWVEWHNSALRDEQGRVISILSLAQDVSSRIQAEERLQFMATHDGLTGLPNGVLLNDRLDAALTRARRSHGRVGVMFLDLDHFKDVNDTLGHRTGDALLKELARRIRGALRQSDLFSQLTICDYLFDRDKIHAYLNLDDNELFIYQRLYELLAQDVPTADLVIYLQTPSETLRRRLRERHRANPDSVLLEDDYVRELKAERAAPKKATRKRTTTR